MSIVLYIKLQCPILINEYYIILKNTNFIIISIQYGAIAFYLNCQLSANIHIFELSFFSMSIRDSLDACYFLWTSDNQTWSTRAP